MTGDILTQLDTELFYWINTQFQSRPLTAFMKFITESNHFIFPGIVMVFFLIWTFQWRGFWFVAVTTTVVIFNDLICYNVLKPLFNRPRPCLELVDTIVYSRCSHNASFPSNHASNIFTLATLFAGVYKNTVVVAFVVAFLVGTSRIYLGVHYPTDVLGGAIIGLVMGLLGIRIYNKILIKVAA